MRPKFAAVAVMTAVTICCAPAATAITGDELLDERLADLGGASEDAALEM